MSMSLNDPREEDENAMKSFYHKSIANLRNDMAIMIYWLFTNLIERRF